MKRNRRAAKMLLNGMHGNSTSDKAQEGNAVKEYLADKGRGRLVGCEELLDEVRARKRTGGGRELDTEAVVGIVDLRSQAAACPTGKAHRPMGVPADVLKAAPAEVARLLDPIVVEATLSADVSLGWQGGDNCMLRKNPLIDGQSLGNHRSIMLADQDAKLPSGVLRRRVVKALEPTMVSSQWGDGFGAASC